MKLRAMVLAVLAVVLVLAPMARPAAAQSKEMFVPSTVYRPRTGSRWRATTARRVLLPEPLGPTTATRCPGSRRRSVGASCSPCPVHEAATPVSSVCSPDVQMLAAGSASSLRWTAVWAPPPCRSLTHRGFADRGMRSPSTDAGERGKRLIGREK